MSVKRKTLSDDDNSNSVDHKCRCSGDDRTPKAPQPRLDPTYGQRGAFPGLDEGGEDDDLFYGPATDGLEYLRMVRCEAKTVPNLLVAESAPSRHTHALDNKSQGYYADGAYTAAPLLACSGLPSPPELAESEPDPQDVYYVSLCARFNQLSSYLQDSPPQNVISTSTNRLAQSLALGSNRIWRNTLKLRPTMAILGQVPQESILRGLQVLESRMTEEHLLKEPNLSLWAWGLLARCREAGQMGSEEVAILRELGKRAVWLLRSMKAGIIQEAENHMEEGSFSDEENSSADEEDGESEQNKDIESKSQDTQALNSDEDAFNLLEELPSDPPPNLSGVEAPTAEHPHSIEALEAAKARLLSSLPSNPPAERTMSVQATIDMIITIVGECYGQKDLLSGRLVWGELDFDAD